MTFIYYFKLSIYVVIYLSDNHLLSTNVRSRLSNIERIVLYFMCKFANALDVLSPKVLY